eukprot:scpid110541/ scgid32865/ 
MIDLHTAVIIEIPFNSQSSLSASCKHVVYISSNKKDTFRSSDFIPDPHGNYDLLSTRTRSLLNIVLHVSSKYPQYTWYRSDSESESRLLHRQCMQQGQAREST